MKFIIKENIECNLIETFTNNGIDYIIYTDDEKDENGEFVIHASRYKLDENKNVILKAIENEYEWDIIDKKLKEME